MGELLGEPDVHGPLAGRGSPRRGRRIALLLTAAVLVLAFAGAYMFARFGAQLARDPGLTSRNARVLSKVLEQGRLAEARGDRASATTAYRLDRKSTRLNSSHGYISYAVFCLKKKKE